MPVSLSDAVRALEERGLLEVAVAVGACVDGLQPGKKSGELSPRQREVLQLFAEGRSMKEIGRILKITPRTVAFHKYSMMEHLGITSNAELVQFAIKQHIAST